MEHWLDWAAAWTAERAIQNLLWQFFSFTLVLIRLSGLMTTAPGFSHPSLPINVRVLMLITMALLITPSIPRTSDAVFRSLDTNHDQRLTAQEIPAALAPEFSASLARSSKLSSEGLQIDEFRLRLDLPPTLLDYAWIGVGEFAMGLLLGMGTMAVFSGLQLAGSLIDQQTGVSLGEVFNPELGSTSSLTGDSLYVFGVTCYFLLGGHILLLSTLIDTFHALPVGHGMVSAATLELYGQLVARSLVLAFQVSAPLLAIMSLVALAMGFLGHTVPQINVLVVGFPIRVLIGLAVVGLAMSGIAERIADVIPITITEIGESLSQRQAATP